MKDGDLLQTAARLTASMEALAALAAYLRIESEGIEVDPQVRDLLAKIAREVVGGEPPTAAPAPVVGMARTFLRQSEDLVSEPGRASGWSHDDEVLLQSIGQLSMSVVGAFRVAESELDGLGDALARDGSRFLDVGTGTGWLAMATARAYPSVQVVGIDVHDPALRLAQRNVTDAQLDPQVDLRALDVVALDEPETYDAIWLPLPFLPVGIVPAALAACARALTPGGWLLAGTFAGPGDRLSELLVDLRTVRSGGHPWRPDELLTMLSTRGFADVREVTRSWAAPVRLHAGRRPPA